MKLAGLWLAIFGYTLLYVGYQNLSGNTVSFVGALAGQQPSANNPSAGLSSFRGNQTAVAVPVSSRASNGGISSLTSQGTISV